MIGVFAAAHDPAFRGELREKPRRRLTSTLKPL